MQINQFLPIFPCSVNLVFYKLFFCSSLPLSVQQVCSTSTCSVILLCFNLFCYSALLQVFFIICYSSLSFISHYAYSQSHTAHSMIFPFLLFHSFSHTEQPTTHSLSHFLLYTLTAVQLPISLGKKEDNCLSN